MSAQLYGPIALDLRDGPVAATYGRCEDGRPFARLVFGEGSQQIAISVTNSPADTLTQLQEAIAQIAAWKQRQEQIKTLPEVA
ncbi:predicted protein [Streptomyces viridosporus ATCC 14672]|uniref:Predicted protein n=1 Tax=Streptomyces viridosporus (strain ATCC 14672 / DSM 40746 / JCM 4963 / KCTC 9882 / NRRL B-12104 / FH 1290) TaxID=566461 RepID=D6A4L1_STRV1|nr:hypothetical protein [Streptomyces viridosporus]EFE65851.1 predicted protein [Streptomyces viridosporus ATCC 14672]